MNNIDFDTLKNNINTDTKSFLINLPQDKLLKLLKDILSQQFTQNFFDIPQIKITYMYLPITKLRELTKLTDITFTDENVLNEINNNFMRYVSDILIIMSQLSTSEQKEFINNTPYELIKKIIESSSDYSINYMKSILLSKDDILKQLSSEEQYTEHYNNLFWCGIR
jgi:hypothetical protein